MPIIKEHEALKQVKGGTEKEALTRGVKNHQVTVQLPSLKPSFNYKHKTEANVLTSNRDSNFQNLDKVSTLTSKLQTKSYKMNHHQMLRLDAKGIAAEKKDSNLKFLNEYHEMSKFLSSNKKTRERIRMTDIMEKYKLAENFKKDEKKLNDILQYLHKDQHQLIDFYHKINRIDYQKPTVATHNLISNSKQKIYI